MKFTSLLLLAIIAPTLIFAFQISDFEQKARKNILVDDINPNRVDYNTFSNYLEVQVENFNIFWTLDLMKQKVEGSVVLEFVALQDAKVVQLDVQDQTIAKILFSDSQTKDLELPFDVHYYTFETEGGQGQQLEIKLDSVKNGGLRTSIKKGNKFQLEIFYSFDDNANAVSFLTKEQTGTKTEPYMYTQCESIFARSIVPLQDTPTVKSTYSAEIIAQKNLNVFMSANKTDTTDYGIDQRKHIFESQLPIPSYLLAIVAGNILEQQVGQRTYVIAEPDMIGKSASDLADLDIYLKTVEDYTQIDYVWGPYKIVILPPSFPFGGMENILLTFASPSIITGDMSGTSVAIHEIAHSWTGNMVTCSNWSNMWLNEGFTVFLERKAQLELFGEDFMLMDSIIGNTSMIGDMVDYGLQSNYSSLYPETQNASPDDSYSEIPYEKGYQFLYYIQSLIGDDLMQNMLTGWISENAFQSRVYQDVQEYFTTYIEKNAQNGDQINSKIDWETWIHTPGLPPSYAMEQIHFETSQQTDANDLAEEWISGGAAVPSDYAKFEDFTPNQKYVFLGTLNDNREKLTPLRLSQMQDCYDLNNSNNKEISFRWFELTIYVGYEGAKDSIFTFLGDIGRQKMVLPQYKAYVATDQRPYALEVFAAHFDFYHPICRINIEQILGLA